MGNVVAVSLVDESGTGVLTGRQGVCWSLHVVLGAALMIVCLEARPASAESPTREQWTTSRVKGTPDPPRPFTTERVFENVEMSQPTEMIRVPGTDRWLVTEVGGRILSFSNSNEPDPQTAMEMRELPTDSSRVYGITFHPRYPQEPWCYIAYTSENNTLTGTRLSRFRVKETSLPTIDPASEVVFAKWNSEGHSGGSLHFGRDGYLYVSVGDGQNPNPPDKLDTGQDLSDLEASVLRIDVDHQSDGLPYRIPEDNPFVGQPDIRGEIWAYGFRNPWKMAFDPVSGSLWTGDVGWEMMEMVYRVDRGANYGWSIMEGSQVVKENGKRTPTPITPPIVEHTHLEARSITGGYFWYSDRIPELHGAYIYGDWMTGKIWGLRHDGSNVTWHQEIADTTLQIICFALDDDGEVLVVGYDGTVHRLIPNPQKSAEAAFPRLLSETGLFRSTAQQIPATGVIPYEINAHHWSDHTVSEQWIAIPGEEQLGIFEKSDWQTGQVKGHFVFPHDTVLAKTVSCESHVDQADSARRLETGPLETGPLETGPLETGLLETRRLETQLLHRNGDDWNAYNYVWNEDQSDAVLQDNIATDREITVIDPTAENGVRKQTWHHASRDECLLCHIWSASTVHGFKLNQLNRPDALREGNQLDRLAELDLFESPPERVPPMVSPTDENATLESRARSYLHMNCAHCHRRGGGGTAAFELVADLPVEKLDLLDALPTQGTFGIEDARVVACGEPSRSILLYRMVKSGRGHMPQFGPTLVDDVGVRLIHDWIASLDSSSPNSPASPRRPKSPRWLGSPNANEVVQMICRQSTPLTPQAIDAIGELLNSLPDALTLSLACCDPTMSSQLRAAIADVASQHSNTGVRDLFERFLPAERRVKRLGTSIDATSLLAMRGDVDAGGKLFFDSADISCRQCHRIGNRGVAVGPDLDSIGIQRTKAEILDSILQPSATIDAKYRGKLLLTFDGSLVSGLVVSETQESMQVVEPSGKTRTLLVDDIESIKPMTKSVMPDMLFSEFTAQQAADLLAFLAAQKRPLDASGRVSAESSEQAAKQQSTVERAE